MFSFRNSRFLSFFSSSFLHFFPLFLSFSSFYKMKNKNNGVSPLQESDKCIHCKCTCCALFVIVQGVEDISETEYTSPCSVVFRRSCVQMNNQDQKSDSRWDCHWQSLHVRQFHSQNQFLLSFLVNIWPMGKFLPLHKMVNEGWGRDYRKEEERERGLYTKHDPCVINTFSDLKKVGFLI